MVTGYGDKIMDKELGNKRSELLWNKKAVGSQRSTSRKGTEEYFDEIRQYRYGYETPFIPYVFDFSDMKGKKVLEIGVGNGVDAVEMITNGADYSGIDITQNHLDLTRENIKLHFDMEVPLFHGDLLEAGIRDTFDIIYSFGVLHHIAHEEDILEKSKDLLKSNGKLMIAVYSKYSFFNMYLRMAWIFKNRMKSPFDDYRSHMCEGTDFGSPVVIKIRTKKQVVNLLEKKGFRVIKYSKKGFVQNYIPLLGKYFQPNGVVLNFFGKYLGWYHCFICKKL